jgi:hypothetical protein
VSNPKANARKAKPSRQKNTARFVAAFIAIFLALAMIITTFAMFLDK